MSKKKIKICPFCGGEDISLEKELRSFVFRKIIVKTKYLFYRCHTCWEQFTDTKTDNNFFKRVINQIFKSNDNKNIKSKDRKRVLNVNRDK